MNSLCPTCKAKMEASDQKCPSCGNLGSASKADTQRQLVLQRRAPVKVVARSGGMGWVAFGMIGAVIVLLVGVFGNTEIRRRQERDGQQKQEEEEIRQERSNRIGATMASFDQRLKSGEFAATRESEQRMHDIVTHIKLLTSDAKQDRNFYDRQLEPVIRTDVPESSRRRFIAMDTWESVLADVHNDTYTSVQKADKWEKVKGKYLRLTAIVTDVQNDSDYTGVGRVRGFMVQWESVDEIVGSYYSNKPCKKKLTGSASVGWPGALKKGESVKIIVRVGDSIGHLSDGEIE